MIWIGIAVGCVVGGAIGVMGMALFQHKNR